MEGKAGEVKYAVKDSVFTLLFSEIGNVRKLYGSLHDDEDNYSDEDFKIITLENALINGQYNDLGFTVRDRLIILVEAQSTFNPNMGVRLLMYIAKSYHDYIIENKLNIFGERLIKLPIPEFIVVYSGAKRQDVNEIRLSDCFESNVSPNIELVVKVIKKDETKTGILQEYLTFCDMYNRYVKGKKTAKEKFQGLRKVIYECIQNGILGEFLKKHQKEVENMLMTVLSPEQAIEFMKLDEYNKGIEDGEARGERRGIEIGEARGIEIGEARGIEIGEARGIEIGKHNTSLNFAKTMLKNNYSIDNIMEITGLSREEIEELM